jgi:hypothetical protein
MGFRGRASLSARFLAMITADGENRGGGSPASPVA